MADELKPAYLLAGTDRPKIDRALERLRRRFELDAVELLSAADVSGEDVARTSRSRWRLSSRLDCTTWLRSR